MNGRFYRFGRFTTYTLGNTLNRFLLQVSSLLALSVRRPQLALEKKALPYAIQ